MLRGLHHLTLRVGDLDTARAFYRAVLDEDPDQDFPGEKLRFRIPGTDTRLVLQPPTDRTPAGDRFDEHRIGLDHVALAVDGGAGFEALVQRLRDAGVAHEVHRDPLGPALVVFRDPDNLQWEFFALS